MIVHDLNLRRSCVRPNEADSPLVVDSDAVLTLSTAFQRFELIAWGRAKEVQSLSRMNLRKLSLRNARVGSKPFDRLALEQGLCVFTLEREDHADSILRPA